MELGSISNPVVRFSVATKTRVTEDLAPHTDTTSTSLALSKDGAIENAFGSSVAIDDLGNEFWNSGTVEYRHPTPKTIAVAGQLQQALRQASEAIDELVVPAPADSPDAKTWAAASPIGAVGFDITRADGSQQVIRTTMDGLPQGLRDATWAASEFTTQMWSDADGASG